MCEEGKGECKDLEYLYLIFLPSVIGLLSDKLKTFTENLLLVQQVATLPWEIESKQKPQFSHESATFFSVFRFVFSSLTIVYFSRI